MPTYNVSCIDKKNTFQSVHKQHIYITDGNCYDKCIRLHMGNCISFKICFLLTFFHLFVRITAIPFTTYCFRLSVVTWYKICTLFTNYAAFVSAIPSGVRVNMQKGSPLTKTSCIRIAKLYTSPVWVPCLLKVSSRRSSGAVHKSSKKMRQTKEHFQIYVHYVTGSKPLMENLTTYLLSSKKKQQKK